MDNGGGSESGESGGESATPKRAHMWLHAESARTLAFSSSTASGPTWVPPRLSPTTILRGDSRQGPSPPFHYAEPTNLSKLNAHQGEEEWANIHTMLNCILSMVEKTRKALGMLQQRSHANQETHHHQWKRRSASANQEMAHEASELRRQAGELIAHTLKATEDRVSQVKRKAEDAVQDVKRAAMGELQRALSTERARAERLAAEARRQGAEETLMALGRHTQVKEICWNCGRRANETCSGCNIARYCSTFCQHKHWEIHHKICARDVPSKSSHQLLLAGSSRTEKESSSSAQQATEPSPISSSPLQGS